MRIGCWCNFRTVSLFRQIQLPRQREPFVIPAVRRGLPLVVHKKGFGPPRTVAPVKRRSHVIQKHSFGAVPCVREEKKDNTDENRCENITSPTHAPRLTSFHKSTYLKLRSICDVPYKCVSRVGGQGGRGNPNGSLANRCPIPPCCSLDTFCQYRKYHSRHRIQASRDVVGSCPCRP